MPIEAIFQTGPGGLCDVYQDEYRRVDEKGKPVWEPLLRFTGTPGEAWLFIHDHSDRSVDWNLSGGGWSVRPHVPTES